MNQMQQMIQQAQRMQRELQKQHAILDEKEFTVSKNGIVTIVMKGNGNLIKVDIDPEAMSDDKEMVEEALMLAINEASAKIKEESAAIEERVTGQKGGFGF